MAWAQCNFSSHLLHPRAFADFACKDDSDLTRKWRLLAYMPELGHGGPALKHNLKCLLRIAAAVSASLLPSSMNS